MRRALMRWTITLMVLPLLAYAALVGGGALVGRALGLTPEAILTALQSAHLRPVRFRGVTETKCFAPLFLRHDEISPRLVRVLEALEDEHFRLHLGTNPVRLVAAPLSSGLRHGGSTITQQLVKNTAFLEGDNALARKLLEPGYALLYELAATKDEILAAYVNHVHFLHGLSGVEAFARYHFGKRAVALDHYEAVLTALAIRRPDRYDPERHPERAREKALTVLAALHERGVITREEHRRAVAPRRGGPGRAEMPEIGCSFFHEAAARLGPALEAGTRRRTYLTINPYTQAQAIGAGEEARPALLRRGGSQIALVAIEHGTGEVSALVGSAALGESAWNRALHARRQIGSLAKVFVTARACEKGYRPGSALMDRPGPDGLPRNEDGRSLGPIPLERAFVDSRNQAYQALAVRIGIDGVAGMARRLLDLEGEVPRVPSIALGSIEATPVQVATMLATIANGGRRVRPTAVRLVIGPYGRVLHQRDPAPPGEPVLSPACAAMVAGLMRGVVRNGTARDAGFDGMPVHGKTGTTNGHADAWFGGFAHRTTLAVWVGNDDPRDRMNGVTGGTVPARLAADFYTGIMALENRRRPRTTVASR